VAKTESQEEGHATDSSIIPTTSKGKQRAQVETYDGKHAEKKSQGLDIDFVEITKGRITIGNADPPRELPNATANTTPFDNDLAAFLGTLSEDIVMSLPGSPKKTHTKGGGESSKRRRTLLAFKPLGRGYTHNLPSGQHGPRQRRQVDQLVAITNSQTNCRSDRRGCH